MNLLTPNIDGMSNSEIAAFLFQTLKDRHNVDTLIILARNLITLKRLHLHSLPLELRTKILQPLLTTNAQVELGRREPPILTVCTQLRSEGLKEYYNSNVFTITISDCNIRPAIPQLKLLLKYNPSLSGRAAKSTIVVKGKMDFANFKEWCRLVKCGKVPKVSPENAELKTVLHVVSGLECLEEAKVHLMR